MWGVRAPDGIPGHPALIRNAEKRAASVQLRAADAITRLAGDMRFVYPHVVWFAVWILFVERYPFPLLTMIVSLEAIFLSAFAMVSQNRADDRRSELADHDHEIPARLDGMNATQLEILNRLDRDKT